MILFAHVNSCYGPEVLLAEKHQVCHAGGSRLPPGGGTSGGPDDVLLLAAGLGAFLRACSLRGAMALSRRPGRSRPIRLFLISMFAVPLVSLVALYAYAASTTIANAVVDQKYNQGVKIVA